MIEFKEFEESWGSRIGFDITPLLDMIFILLIFFLLTAGATHPAVPVDLPDSDTAEKPQEQSAVVSVDDNLRLFFNGEAVSGELLERRLKTLYGEGKTGPVYIEADESVSFGTITGIMDLCRKSGAPGISFLVEQADTPD